MTRVVVDSNYVGRGDFSVRRLKVVVSLLGNGGEVVVPEVVVWEWAEHAAQAIEQLVDQTARLPVDAAVYEPAKQPIRPSKDDLIRAIESNLPPGVSIWRATPDQHADAVRAQVLQTGTAERKGGVKTGAADHLVAECLAAQLQERRNAEAVVLASNDKRLRKVCREIYGDEVLFASGDVELIKALVDFAPAEAELLEAVEENLIERLSWTEGIAAELVNFSMGYYFSWRSSTNRPMEREIPSMRRIEIVELHDLQVGAFENHARIGIAHVRVFGTVHMTVLEWNAFGDDDAEADWVTTYDDDLPNGIVDLLVAILFDRTWQVQSVTSASEARIHFDRASANDLDDFGIDVSPSGWTPNDFITPDA